MYLKPCPFCGSDDLLVTDSGITFNEDAQAWVTNCMTIKCKMCRVEMCVIETKAKDCEVMKNAVREKWNRRCNV